jgi:putative ABC transport system permease protein
MKGTLAQDLRYGFRMLAKNPGFTAIAILTLALGIGANTAIFSVIDGVLLRPLPYKDSQQLVDISAVYSSRGIKGLSVSFTKLTQVQRQARSFESVGAYFSTGVSIATNGVPEQVSAAKATANFFSVLGVSPAHGRGFLPQEDQDGGADVAIITDGFWHSHFGGTAGMIGKSIPLDGKSVTLVGILPATFRFPFVQPEPDVWLPRVFDDPALGPERIRSGASYLVVYGRLREGESIAQAQAELDAVNQTYKKDFPGFVDSSNHSLVADSLKETLVGSLRSSLLVLLAAVGFVLLIGCANVASLLLARATAREKEIAIRRALGASKHRLIRQLITESLLLSCTGGILGVVLAWGALGLIALLPQGSLPRVTEIHIDASVLGFSLLLCFLTGLAFGLAPSLKAARADLHGTLKEGGRSSTGGRRGGRSRAALVVAEVAVAVVLVTGAGLLMRSFSSLMTVKPGFDPKNVMTFLITLPQSSYAQPEQQSEFYRRLVESTETLPSVDSAGVVSYLPMTGAVRYVYFCPDGVVCQGIGKDPLVALKQITPDYFKAMSIPLLRGRTFDGRDIDGANRVVIINQMVANHYFPGQDPIGRHLAQSRGMIQTEIVGVVEDVKLNGLNAPSVEEMYLPQAQTPAATMWLVVRSGSNLQPLIAAVRQKVTEMDSSLPVADVNSMESVLSASVAQPRLTTQFTGIFAFLALLLTAGGIYGVLAYSVTQRTHELGIRMALGAQRGEILRLVIMQGMSLVLAGVGLGLAASLVLTRLLQTLLVGTSARDPLTYGGVILVLVIVTLAACYIPARRAMRVDPMVALRYE